MCSARWAIPGFERSKRDPDRAASTMPVIGPSELSSTTRSDPTRNVVSLDFPFFDTIARDGMKAEVSQRRATASLASAAPTDDSRRPKMQPPETRYARSKDGDVAYQIVGDGPRDLVFVPWWGTNLDVMWEEPSIARFLSRLATFSRLLCFDKRGTGVSDPVALPALPSLEQWSDDIRTVMDAAGSKRAA